MSAVVVCEPCGRQRNEGRCSTIFYLNISGFKEIDCLQRYEIEKEERHFYRYLWLERGWRWRSEIFWINISQHPKQPSITLSPI